MDALSHTDLSRDERLSSERDSGSVRYIASKYYTLSNICPVLRVFGIYTHAQMRIGLWDSVGARFNSKDPEYRKK